MALEIETLLGDLRDRVFRLSDRPPPPVPAEGAIDPGRAEAPALTEDPFPRLDPPPPPPRRIGVEVEVIPVAGDPPRICPIQEGEGAPATVPWIRSHARDHGWQEEESPGAPRFRTPEGCILFFEPGGQLELSTLPVQGPGRLLALLQATMEPLHASAREAGITLLSEGLDPFTPLAETALVLRTPRYQAMDRYLGAIGEDGLRMMRQTASCQINMDFPGDPLLAFRMLNGAAPALTAMFANSPRYEGADTGWASRRAGIWLGVDPARTGLLRAAPPGWGEMDALSEYLALALDAPWILAGSEDFRPFRDSLTEATYDDWRLHLTTLFPEIRPRGYLEVRCLDALPLVHLGPALVILEGLVHHRPTLEEAARLVGKPDRTLLEPAARDGLRDPLLAGMAAELGRLGLAGASALGVVEPEHLDACAAFLRGYTLARRSPGDDLREPAIRAIV